MHGQDSQIHCRRCTIFLQLPPKLFEAVKENKKQVLEKGFARLELPDTLIDTNLISKQAFTVLKTLHAAGYDAYLVGGGVRDLILGKTPKDFDIVTNAIPEKAAKLFSRARVIGRRFKLVHVIFGPTIIEVATFRRNTTPSSVAELTTQNNKTSATGMVVRDNLYGTSLSEDASRRDYTINALYYSPFTRKIYDFHGGLFDMVYGNIDIIGDPEVRFREDPVRMIRAYRFAAKLNFQIVPRTAKKIPDLLPLLSAVPTARMYEEVVKLFLTGHGAQTFDVMMRDDAFKLLFTPMGSMLYSKDYVDFISYALSSSDKRHNEGKHNMPHFLFAVILWPLCEQLFFKMQSIEPYRFERPNVVMSAAADIILRKQKELTNIPQLAMEDIKDIWCMQVELEDENNQHNPETMVWQGIFRASLEFLSIRARFDENLASIAAQWIESYEFYVPPEKRSRKSLTKQDMQQGANNPNTEFNSKPKKKRNRNRTHNRKNTRDSKAFSKEMRKEKVDFKAASEYVDNLPF